MRSKFRVYLIGLMMGIADLIPGVSGGTIAFVCGIYEELLNSIQTLRIQAMHKISWRFLLPLGAGIATSILLFSKLFYFLLLHFEAPLFGFFFGLIVASTLTYAKEAKIKRPRQFLPLLLGFSLSLILTFIPSHLFFGSGFLGILFAALLGTGAMLFPGISGSFILQVIGVYPLVIHALSTPSHPDSLKLLMTMGIGVSLGFILFSRVISFLLSRFRQTTITVLVGFMAGGLKVLWPFDGKGFVLPALLMVVGFSLIICLEIRAKHVKKVQGIN